MAILRCNLKEVCSVKKEDTCYALCKFLPKVTKVDGSDYLGKTRYEMVTSIQKFLHQNKKMWKIIDDPEFADIRTVLDNLMKERAVASVRMVHKQAKYIPIEFENQLWNRNVLSEDTPDKLKETVLFL